MVLAEGVSAQEFMELSSQYGISSVPDTVINGKGRVVGAVPENNMIEEIKNILGK